MSTLLAIVSRKGKVLSSTLCLLVTSANNLCKQFRPRSGQTKRRARSESKLFDTLMIFLKEFFKKLDFEQKKLETKNHEKLPSMQRIKNKQQRRGLKFSYLGLLAK